VLWSKELIERKNSKSNAEPVAGGSVWVESIESPKSKITDQSQKKSMKPIIATATEPFIHSELSNYEVDIGDELITEL